MSFRTRSPCRESARAHSSPNCVAAAASAGGGFGEIFSVRFGGELIFERWLDEAPLLTDRGTQLRTFRDAA